MTFEILLENDFQLLIDVPALLFHFRITDLHPLQEVSSKPAPSASLLSSLAQVFSDGLMSRASELTSAEVCDQRQCPAGL